jgi:drug/metabolite transporter (DMT)-like permease
LMAAAMQMLAGGLVSCATGLLAGEGSRVSLSAVTGHSWVAFFYLVVVGSLVAFPVYAWLLTHSTPSRVSTYAYVNPVVAVFLGWAILDEPLNAHILLAAAIIIGAVAIITVEKARTAGA